MLVLFSQAFRTTRDRYLCLFLVNFTEMNGMPLNWNNDFSVIFREPPDDVSPFYRINAELIRKIMIVQRGNSIIHADLTNKFTVTKTKKKGRISNRQEMGHEIIKTRNKLIDTMNWLVNAKVKSGCLLNFLFYWYYKCIVYICILAFHRPIKSCILFIFIL